jgi:hypothetical protein
MSSYHREPVYYGASAPSRSYYPTHSGRSRSASHSSPSYNSDPYYHSSSHRRASTSSHGRSPPVYYVTNTRSHEEPIRHRSSTATYYYPSSSRGYENRDHGRHRRYSHGDSGHHRHESRGFAHRDAGRYYHDDGHHVCMVYPWIQLAWLISPQSSTGDKLRRLLGMPPHHRMVYSV